MSDDDCNTEAPPQPLPDTADQAAFASSKKARQLELRRSRNRRAQSRFRSKAKAQHEEWSSELELLREQVQILQDEKRRWLAEKEQLVTGVHQMRCPANGPLDLAYLSPLLKVHNGVLDYTAMPACMDALMHMYGRLEAIPILDLKRVQADELLVVRKDLIGMMKHLTGDSGCTSELNALMRIWVAQVRCWYRSSGYSMGNIYWSEQHAGSRSSELRRWSELVAAIDLSIQQQEQIREAAVRRHLWVSHIVNEQRRTGHDFQGFDQDFLEQVYTFGTYSKAVTVLGHLQGVLDAMLNIQVEFLAEVCEIMSLRQAALVCVHSFETIGTVMLHVPGIGILDAVLAQSRVCEELDSVDAFLNQVPNINGLPHIQAFLTQAPDSTPCSGRSTSDLPVEAAASSVPELASFPGLQNGHLGLHAHAAPAARRWDAGMAEPGPDHLFKLPNRWPTHELDHR